MVKSSDDLESGLHFEAVCREGVDLTFLTF